LKQDILNDLLGNVRVPKEVERDSVEHRLMRANDRLELPLRDRHPASTALIS
jgi:hypothetical protein